MSFTVTIEMTNAAQEDLSDPQTGGSVTWTQPPPATLATKAKGTAVLTGEGRQEAQLRYQAGQALPKSFSCYVGEDGVSAFNGNQAENEGVSGQDGSFTLKVRFTDAFA